MEKINTEILVSSLFAVGFDKVDSVLFSLILGKIFVDNQQNQLFEFCDHEITPTFKKYVDFDGNKFKIKAGFSLDTNVSKIEGYYVPLEKRLKINSNLINYLNNLDFSEIILKKMELYKIKNIEDMQEDKFCDKEIEIFMNTRFYNNEMKTQTMKKVLKP